MHPVTRSSINDILLKADNQPPLTALESIVITGLLDSGQYKIGDRIDFPTLCMDIIRRRKLIDDLNDGVLQAEVDTVFPSVSATLRKFEGLPNNEATRASMADTINHELNRLYNEGDKRFSPGNQEWLDYFHRCMWNGVADFLPPAMVMNPPNTLTPEEFAQAVVGLIKS